jgi:two-component system, OmpR family, sensor histidine kinase KdpD
MPEEPPELTERIRHEARVVGLRDFRTPSLEAVESRRMQLWIITTILLVAISAGVALLSWLPAVTVTWLTPKGLRWGVVVLSVAFCAYAIEKELHLRRLSRLLIDERILSTALSNRLHELKLILEAGRAMNSVLELEAVLDTILRSATELLQAGSGSIMLVDGRELETICSLGNDAARGHRVRIGQSIAGHVALSLEPLLISGRADAEAFPGLVRRELAVESAMSVPLVHREALTGVLNVNAERDREFTEYDLRAISLFAEQAAGAIANARLYEAERRHVIELMELDRLKTQFIDLVTHELRTPLTAIVAASEMAKRPQLEDDRPELLDIIERNGKHIAAMLDELLMSVRLDQNRGIGPLATVDVAELARNVVREFELTGRPVFLDTPSSAPILSNLDALRRVFHNLLDNAHKYGAAPVRMLIEPTAGGVIVWVIDAGGGIPPEDRERVFDRFARLRQVHGKPGLGLGLSIVRSLAIAFGGSVRIEDAPGGGAAFRVELPAIPAHQQAG